MQSDGPGTPNWTVGLPNISASCSCKKDSQAAFPPLLPRAGFTTRLWGSPLTPGCSITGPVAWHCSRPQISTTCIALKSKESALAEGLLNRLALKPVSSWARADTSEPRKFTVTCNSSITVKHAYAANTWTLTEQQLSCGKGAQIIDVLNLTKINAQIATTQEPHCHQFPNRDHFCGKKSIWGQQRSWARMFVERGLPLRARKYKN
ncbi:hypothetical protein Q8A73_011149 [Channa argus]|nr:hypothetical protein Q8A73_011149 [Channa argus]